MLSLVSRASYSSHSASIRSPAALDLIAEGHNGTVREPTAEALATGLLQVLAPATLPRMQHEARESARQYDLPVRAQALEEVYERVIAARRGKGTPSRFFRSASR